MMCFGSKPKELRISLCQAVKWKGDPCGWDSTNLSQPAKFEISLLSVNMFCDLSKSGRLPPFKPHSPACRYEDEVFWFDPTGHSRHTWTFVNSQPTDFCFRAMIYFAVTIEQPISLFLNGKEDRWFLLS